MLPDQQRATPGDLLRKSGFMEGARTLAMFKDVLRSRTYWADMWAVQEIQKALKLKLVVVRNGVVQVDMRPLDLPLDWTPDAFVVLDYDGEHYDLLIDEHSASARFTFGQLPPSLRDQVRNAAVLHGGGDGCWFAALDLAEPQPCSPEAVLAPVAEAARAARPRDAEDTDDGRMNDFGDEDTSGGVVEIEEQKLEMDKLRERLQGLVEKDASAGQPPSASHPGGSPLAWPQQGSALVDERSTYGTFTKAFPTLFPRGHEDITSVTNAGMLSLEDWGQYLMRHSCGRFAKHARFRYYLFNRIQREKAAQTGAAFHKHYTGDGIATVDDLKQLLIGGDKTMCSRLEWWSQNLRGTASWKKARRGELRDLVATLGLPTFFVTLSAADLHWHFLHDAIVRHGASGKGPEAVQEALRSAMSRVVQNPHIVSAFFVERAKALFAQQYGDSILDSWFVNEWQGRGSVHIHGLLWLADTPAIANVGDLVAAWATGGVCKAEYDEKLRQWARYYDEYITGFNPAVIPR